MSSSENIFSVEYRELRYVLHTRLLEDIDLESLRLLSDEIARQRVTDEIRNLLKRERSSLTLSEREDMVKDILDELFGLGPLEPLLADNTVSDILVNGCNAIYVERYGKLERTTVRFDDNAHLSRIIDRIVTRVGRRIGPLWSTGRWVNLTTVCTAPGRRAPGNALLRGGGCARCWGPVPAGGA